ncbi:hypothetical protein [Rheinheimera sp.]|uniref:hypothetical protein n=1 Tax=Rheinheimera sp. TaxID=1869214 RepID=UPI0027BA332F|nr:hypothetical protein [Rheinheimera sp.]
MKIIHLVLTLFAFVMSGLSHAAVINIEYSYDGSNFKLLTGQELFGTNLAVGDTLNIKYLASGTRSYWDFSNINFSSMVNLSFANSGCVTRSANGNYQAYMDGRELLNRNYNAQGQTCIHTGPQSIDFREIAAIDVFAVSFTLNKSSQANNVIADYKKSGQNTAGWWEMWELFNGNGAKFYYIADLKPQAVPPLAVAAPSPLWLFFAAVPALALLRRNRKA